MTQNLVTTFKRGDILLAENNWNKPKFGIRHFILCLTESGELSHDFTGGMLTTSTKFPCVAMDAGMFEKMNDEGIEWPVQYKESQLTLRKFIKFSSWGPFHKVGQLSPDGISFLVQTIGDLPAEQYEGNR